MTGVAADVPDGTDWLTPAELGILGSLGSDRRRCEWRLGRWLAKEIAVACGFAAAGRLDSVEIGRGTLGRPVVCVRGDAADLTVSISHKRGRAVCFAARGAPRLGCDLELVARRHPRFATRWLLPSEQGIAAAAADPDAAATLLWAAKEATLKALGTGWRRPLSSVEVRLDPAPHHDVWNSAEVKDHVESRTWSGWWRPQGGHLITVVADPPPSPPPPHLATPPGGSRD